MEDVLATDEAPADESPDLVLSILLAICGPEDDADAP